MSNIKLVYITCKNVREANDIAKKLLKNRLVACSNIISNTTSFFKWNNKLKKNRESILIAKTIKKKKIKIIDMVKKNHSYVNPCIIFFDVESGSELFFNWINTCLK